MIRNSSDYDVLSIFWQSAENARTEIVRQLAEIGNRISELEESDNSLEDFTAQVQPLRELREALTAKFSSLSPIGSTPHV